MGKTPQVQMAASKFEEGGVASVLRLAEVERLENGSGANGCKQIWGGRCPVGIEVGGGEAAGKTVQVQMAASKFGEGGIPSVLRLVEVKRRGKRRRCKWLQANLGMAEPRRH